MRKATSYFQHKKDSSLSFGSVSVFRYSLRQGLCACITRLLLCVLASISLAACDSGDSNRQDSVDDLGNNDGGSLSNDGLLADGATFEEPTCAEVSASLNSVVPTVALLIDRSSSMTWGYDEATEATRWDSVYSALMDESDGVVKQLADRVRFGLVLYTGQNGEAPCPLLTKVAPALDNFAAIDAVYSAQQPDDDTPTGESVDAVVADLKTVTAPGPKIIVLATDGEPNSCAYPNPEQERDPAEEARQWEYGRQLSLSAIENAFDAGIETFVIAVGSDIGADHLQDIANAGAGFAVNGGVNAPYFPAEKPEELVSAFSSIVQNAADQSSCLFTLKGSTTESVVERAVVTLDGVSLTYGTQWTVVDDTLIELLGEACSTVIDGADHTVEAKFPCALDLY